MGETCETCRFYDARFRGHVVSGAMECRRYPTRVPKVWTDWCGEHQPKEATDGE